MKNSTKQIQKTRKIIRIKKYKLKRKKNSSKMSDCVYKLIY